MARLVVGDNAADVRRSLGSSAWAALEVLVGLADPSDDALIATTSIRDIADALGVAINTAHRAIRRLIAAGLAVPDQQRSTDGRFCAGHYRLNVHADVLQPASNGAKQPPSPASPERPSKQARHRTAHGTQLDLLTSWD